MARKRRVGSSCSRSMADRGAANRVLRGGRDTFRSMSLTDLAELDDRQIAIILSRARCVIGLSCMAAPSVFSTIVLGERGAATKAVTRFAGVRDLALGVGALTSLKEHTQDAEWLSMGAVSDAFDGAVMMLTPGLPKRARLFGAGAFAFGSYLLYLSRLLAAERSEVVLDV